MLGGISNYRLFFFQVVSSDHKPVRARFAIKSSLPVTRAGKGQTMLAHITELKATGLTEMDGVLQGGMSDPCKIETSNVLTLLWLICSLQMCVAVTA